MIHHNVFAFNLINFLLGFSESLAAEETKALSLLQTPHVCVVSGVVELLPSYLRARLSAAAVISLSSDCLEMLF